MFREKFLIAMLFFFLAAVSALGDRPVAGGKAGVDFNSFESNQNLNGLNIHDTLQAAGLGQNFGGRPGYGNEASGVGVGAVNGIRPAIASFASQFGISGDELNNRISAINNTVDPLERRKLMDDTRAWLKTHKATVTDNDLYQKLCVNPWAGLPPSGANEAQGLEAAPVGESIAELAEITSPIVRPILAGFDEGTKAPAIGAAVGNAVGDELTSPVRGISSLLDTATSPVRRSSLTDENFPIGNQEGCSTGFNGNQNNPQVDDNQQQDQANNENAGEGDSEGGSPSNDQQSPQGGGGGGQYQSKNKGVKPVDIADFKPPGAMPQQPLPDGNCVLCSAISEAGKSRYQYDSYGVLQAIDADSQRFQSGIYQSLDEFGKRIRPPVRPPVSTGASTGQILSRGGSRSNASPIGSKLKPTN